MTVQHLDLNVRAHNCLRAGGIITIADLVEKAADDLLAIPQMGRSTVAVIEQALANVGLELGMSGAGDVRDLERFIGAMDHLKTHGVAAVNELVDMSVDELLAIRNFDKETVKVVERGLLRWGLRLGMRGVQISDARSASNSANSRNDSHQDDGVIVLENCSVFKEELVHGISQLLPSSKQSTGLPCFLAYHGIEGGPAATLQGIADKGLEYGFERSVSRERVRQVLQKVGKRLRSGAHRVRFTKWESAVADALNGLPSTIHVFVANFGYDSHSSADDTYDMLELCAGIFGLDFPFHRGEIKGVGTFVLGLDSDSDGNELGGLPKFAGGSHCELSEVARALGVREEILIRAIDGSPYWEFLTTRDGVFGIGQSSRRETTGSPETRFSRVFARCSR